MVIYLYALIMFMRAQGAHPDIINDTAASLRKYILAQRWGAAETHQSGLR